jgi:hypothetical protein
VLPVMFSHKIYSQLCLFPEYAANHVFYPECAANHVFSRNET